MSASAEQLMAFAALCEAGSVAGAAEALGVSQGTVSGRLRGLREVAGDELYTGRGSTLTLTAAGEGLLPHAQAVARAMSRATSALVAPADSPVEASVAFSEAAVPFVVPRLASAALANSRLSLGVVPCDASTAVASVVAGEIDLAVAVGSPVPPADDLDRRALLVDDILPVRRGPQDPVVDITELASLTVLWQAPGSGVRATALRVLEDAGVTPGASVELGSTLGVLAAVAAGYGVGLLPGRYVQPWIAMGAVTSATLDAPDLYARFELISAPREELHEGARLLYDALQQPIAPVAESGL